MTNSPQTLFIGQCMRSLPRTQAAALGTEMAGLTPCSQNPATLPCRSYWSARSILAVTISPTRKGRRLVR
ncbi:hypothetical protein EDE08_103568 [Bradyrhizobium sp. R2.2-H]|nr:hypothetical protein EDE10_103567 [Bradyrhizobium sp. Y-H1]TCU78115.1 hypothetical protein EDE08_103568 [Bradyrhizobium sp. R2.2-H]